MAVIAVPHERLGETVKAVVVRQPGPSLTFEEVLACPTSLDVVAALPRNASGKKDLRAPYLPASPPRV